MLSLFKVALLLNLSFLPVAEPLKSRTLCWSRLSKPGAKILLPFHIGSKRFFVRLQHKLLLLSQLHPQAERGVVASPCMLPNHSYQQRFSFLWRPQGLAAPHINQSISQSQFLLWLLSTCWRPQYFQVSWGKFSDCHAWHNVADTAVTSRVDSKGYASDLWGSVGRKREKQQSDQWLPIFLW